MIQSFFRNSINFGLLSTVLLVAMGLMAFLMGMVVVQFTFPAIGTMLARWIGDGRFAELIQLLF